MRVSPPELVESPLAPGRVRLQAWVHFRNPVVPADRVWFDFDEQLASQVSLSGSPWLVALLPLALTRHEPLEVEAPVDPLVMDHAQKLQSIWTSWYPRLSQVDVIAEFGAATPSDRRTGVFFSGGINSFYTVLHAQAEGDLPVDELLFVQGADYFHDNLIAFDAASASIRDASQVLGIPVQFLATNLRSTHFRQLHYDRMGSAPLLGAAGLALESRYRQLLISSTWSDADLHPLASHPDTDPLLSSQATTFIHYGIWADRIQKTEYISRHPVALDHLRVCWESPKGDNCGRCLKCLRTMVALEVIGELEHCRAFPSQRLDLESIRRLHLGREWRYFRNLLQYARANGRPDIAGAIEQAFDRTARIDRWMLFGLVWRARMHFKDIPWARTWFAPVFQQLRRAAAWLNRRLPSAGDSHEQP